MASGAATDTEAVHLGLEALVRRAPYQRLSKLLGSEPWRPPEAKAIIRLSRRSKALRAPISRTIPPLFECSLCPFDIFRSRHLEAQTAQGRAAERVRNASIKAASACPSCACSPDHPQKVRYHSEALNNISEYLAQDVVASRFALSIGAVDSMLRGISPRSRERAADLFSTCFCSSAHASSIDLSKDKTTVENTFNKPERYCVRNRSHNPPLALCAGIRDPQGLWRSADL